MAETPDILSVDPALVETLDLETATWHKPGSPVETTADREAREALAEEPVLETQPEPHDGIPPDTRDPVANLASRDNIVPSGPGSVADFL